MKLAVAVKHRPEAVRQTFPELVPLAYSVKEAARALSIGRTRLYELINTGQLRAFKLGRRTLVPREAILALLADAGRS